jgi:hypothetical protein
MSFWSTAGKIGGVVGSAATGNWGGVALGLASPLLARNAPRPPTPEEIMARMFGMFDKQMAPARQGMFAAEAGAAATMRQDLAGAMGRSGAGGSGMGMAAAGLANSQFGTSLARSETQYRGMLSQMVSSAMGGPLGDPSAWMHQNKTQKMMGGYAQLLSSPDFAKMLAGINEKRKGKTA